MFENFGPHACLLTLKKITVAIAIIVATDCSYPRVEVIGSELIALHTIGHSFLRAVNFADFTDFGTLTFTKFLSPKINGNSISCKFMCIVMGALNVISLK